MNIWIKTDAETGKLLKACIVQENPDLIFVENAPDDVMDQIELYSYINGEFIKSDPPEVEY